MNDYLASNETVCILASRVEQLQTQLNKLTHAIRENACINNDGKKVMLGWARQALGEEMSDSTPNESTYNRIFAD